MEIYKQRQPKWEHKKDRYVGGRLEKLKKDDSPSPVSYEKQKDAYLTKTSNFPKVANFSITKYKEQSFIDREIKRHSLVPGCGHYKGYEDSFKMLSNSIVKSKRH